VLRVFEPRYMEMLSDLQQQAAAGRGIVHVLSPAVVARIPELQRDAVGGMPRVGTLMTVKSVRDDGDAAKMVSYDSTCRVRLLTLQPDERPYPVRSLPPS
jgi:Lon protease-like protein